MFCTKRIIVICGVVLATAAFAFADETPNLDAGGVYRGTSSSQGDAEEAEQIESLRGTWICVESFYKGQRVDGYVGVRAVFDGNNMTWIFPKANGADHRQVCRFEIDASRNPKHFDWYPADKPKSRALRLYTIEDGNLYMATNLSSKVRPSSFDDTLWTFRCRKFQSGKTSPVRSAATTVTLAKPVVSCGTVIDPDGDCSFRDNNGDITISVPRGEHELWYGARKSQKRFNAPRVMREIEGDFVAQVKVTGNWQPNNTSYARAAGLVVWDSPKQYLRHERCHFIHSGTGEHACFKAPVYDVNYRRVSDANAGSNAHYQGTSTWLLMQRKGQTIHTWIKHERGSDWQHTGSVTTQFPRRVQVGIDAINRSSTEFTVLFEDLRITER